jgi:hypothetical protein
MIPRAGAMFGQGYCWLMTRTLSDEAVLWLLRLLLKASGKTAAEDDCGCETGYKPRMILRATAPASDPVRSSAAPKKIGKLVHLS